MRIALAVLLLSAASAAQASYVKPDKTEIVLFAVAQGLIVTDCLQTLDIKNHKCAPCNASDGSQCPPCSEIKEMNPFLGPHPRDAWILGLGAITVVGSTALWLKLEPPWKNVLSIALIGIETAIVTRNAVYFNLSIHL